MSFTTMRFASEVMRPYRDSMMILLIALSTLVYVLALGGRIPSVFYQRDNLYFDSDIARIFENLTGGRMINLTLKHPIFPILVRPIVRMIRTLGFDPLTAVRLIIAISGAVMSAALYGFSRSIGGSICQSILVSLLAISSASFTYWWGTTETFPIASATLAATLSFLVSRNASFGKAVAINVATLGVTTTNWLFAILCTVSRRGPREAIRVASFAAAIVAALLCAQHFLIPNSTFFFVMQEFQYVVKPTSVQALFDYCARIINIVVYTGVSSAPKVGTRGTYQTVLNFSAFGWVAVVAWVALLTNGCLAIWSSEQARKVGLPIALFMLFQLAFHTFYGPEPFLYSPHYLPGFAAIISLGLVFRPSKAWQWMAALFVATAMVANHRTFREALDLASSI